MSLEADKDLILRLEAIKDDLRMWEVSMLDAAHARLFKFGQELVPSKRVKIKQILKRREDTVEELPTLEAFERKKREEEK